MQLEEFARAVRSSYVNQLSDDARDRHREFIVAIDDQISRIENSLQEATLCQGKASMPWVSLDDGECDELALFLSGQSPSEEKISLKIHEKNSELPRQKDKESAVDHSKNSSNQVEWSSLEVSEGKCDGHRRTASASADIGAWKIAISDDGYLQNPTNGHCQQPPRKTPSFAGFLNSMEFATNLKWPKSNVRKWKAMDRQPEKDTTLLQPTQPTKVSIHSFFIPLLYFLFIDITFNGVFLFLWLSCSRSLIHVMKKVRVAWIVMIVMINNFMAGMELSRDSFKGLSIRCNIVGLFKLQFGFFFSFA